MRKSFMFVLLLLWSSMCLASQYHTYSHRDNSGDKGSFSLEITTGDNSGYYYTNPRYGYYYENYYRDNYNDDEYYDEYGNAEYQMHHHDPR